MCKPIKMVVKDNIITNTQLIKVEFLLMTFLLVLFPILLGPLETLDQRLFGYSLQETQYALETYGEEGRSRYYWVGLSLDTLLPVLYSLFFIQLFRTFHLKIDTRWKHLIHVLLCTPGLCDFIENRFIAHLLNTYPKIDSSTVYWASFFTQIKFLSLSVTCILLFITWQFVRRK